MASSVPFSLSQLLPLETEQVRAIPPPAKPYSEEARAAAKLFVIAASYASMLNDLQQKWHRTFSLRFADAMRDYRFERASRGTLPLVAHYALGNLIGTVETPLFDGVPVDDMDRPVPGAKCLSRGKRRVAVEKDVRSLLLYLFDALVRPELSREATERLCTYAERPPYACTWLAAGELLAMSDLELPEAPRIPLRNHWSGLARQLLCLLYPAETTAWALPLCAVGARATQYRFCKAVGLDEDKLAKAQPPHTQQEKEEEKEDELERLASEVGSGAATTSTTTSTTTHHDGNNNTTTVITTTTTVAVPAADATAGFVRSPPQQQPQKKARKPYLTSEKRMMLENSAYLGYTVRWPRWCQRLEESKRRQAARKVTLL